MPIRIEPLSSLGVYFLLLFFLFILNLSLCLYSRNRVATVAAAAMSHFIICEEENAKQYIRLFWFHASTHRCNWKPCLYILLVSLLLLPVFVMKKKLILAWTLWKHLLIYICIQTLDTHVFDAVRSLSCSRLQTSKCARYACSYVENSSIFLSISLHLCLSFDSARTVAHTHRFAISIVACLFCPCT